jgi:hypothetical protein
MVILESVPSPEDQSASRAPERERLHADTRARLAKGDASPDGPAHGRRVHRQDRRKRKTISFR